MSEIRERIREQIAFIASKVKRGNIGTFDCADQILSIPEIAIVDRDKRIKISISCGRSTDYADEYWIADVEDNPIFPSDFGSARVGIWVKEIME